MKWRTFAIAIAFVCLHPLAHAQRCGSWYEALMNSFMPKQVDEDTLKIFVQLTPGQYFSELSSKEQAQFGKSPSFLVVKSPIEYQLRVSLSKFYEVGERLYGLRLDPGNFGIVENAEPNAFATGGYVFLHQGLIQYFADPIPFLVSVGILPQQMSREQYAHVAQVFDWKNDWQSVEWVLAHEAAHNLMRHRDQQVFEYMQSSLDEYKQQVHDRRKDLAEGRSGGGFKRYLWRSTLSFLNTFDRAEKHRELESEADLIAMVLFRHVGRNSDAGLIAGQRMMKLLGGTGAGGIRAALTTTLCSTHPDWLARISKMRSEGWCIRTGGSPCQPRITYPVEQFLPAMKSALQKIQAFAAETEEIASGTHSSERTNVVKFELNPKDGKLFVDDIARSQNQLSLTVGRHSAFLEHAGIRSEPVEFVVFPDIVGAKIKLKLKK